MPTRQLDLRRCTFGPFDFDPANRRLLRDGVAVPITARVFDILAVLIEHAGAPVSKERLVELVWGDVSVEEGNLARNVSTLRKLLGEHPEDHRYIVTLPGRGYQFVAAVRPLSGAEAAPLVAPRPPARRGTAWVSLAAAAALVAVAAVGYRALARPGVAAGSDGQSRLVVLPFKNLGGADDEYFAKGVTEEVTTRLSVVRGLQVISRTTADRYGGADRTATEIGREHRADYLLEGSVRLDHRGGPEGLRVTAQLIDARDDTHRWSASYDRELTAVFEVQSDIARHVVTELRGALAPGEAADLSRAPTRHLEAYRAYARGRFFAGIPNMSEAHLARVVSEYQRAVDLDPQFVLAYAALSRTHEFIYRFGIDLSDERAGLARAALERAEALAPQAPAVLLARGRYESSIAGDAAAALRTADAAERLQPNDAAVISAAAHIRLLSARWQESADSYARAVRLDPRDAGAAAVLGLVHIAMRRYGDAQVTIERSLDIEPDQVLATVLEVWNMLLWRGDVAAAGQRLDRLKRHDDWRFVELQFLRHLYERDYAGAREALVPFAGQWMRDWVLTRPVVLCEAQAWRLEGNAARARAAFDRARELLEAEATRVPGDGRIRSSLAIALAGLGRADEARREAGAALSRMRLPLGFDTAAVREDVALALTMVGDTEAALSELEQLMQQPAFFSERLLRLDPRWEPLRSVPRYSTHVARQRAQ
jgi:TolB-like protein/DNA-binding winged helix-turn-helix (wHTH) protein